MVKILESYGGFLSKRPFLVIAVCVLLLMVSNIGSSLVTQSTTDFSEQVPQELESIRAFNFVEDEFGSQGSSVIFAIEPDPDYIGSDESRDMRDPDVIRYMDLIGEKARTLEKVTRVTSAADLLKQANGGRLPASRESVKGIMDSAGLGQDWKSNPFSSYLSEDFSIAAVRVSFTADTEAESEEIVNELLQIAGETSAPSGIKNTLTGGPVTSIVLMETIGPTFAITGTLSFVGILVVVVLIFYSLRYGLTSLLAIVFGSVWTFGLLGFTGLSLSENTSGALSLIMGIGIDFGIQVVTRFRQELRNLDARKAVAKTMPNVIPPMTISALAIFLGFRTLAFGNLQFIGELGEIMSIGVIMSYLAAITVVPAALVMLNTFSLKSLLRGK
jgi:predicted RND superfamily exporter protein